MARASPTCALKVSQLIKKKGGGILTIKMNPLHHKNYENNDRINTNNYFIPTSPGSAETAAADLNGTALTWL